MNLEERGVGGTRSVEEGESVVWVLCMKEESIFNLEKKELAER